MLLVHFNLYIYLLLFLSTVVKSYHIFLNHGSEIFPLNMVRFSILHLTLSIFGSRQQLSKVSLPFITIGDSQITPSSQAQNLGVIFDSTMTLKPRISNTVRV